MHATVVLGKQGRLVIPADVREALALEPGEALHLQLSGGRVIIERPADAARALRGYARDVPSSRSLVDELIAERRAAANEGE